VIEIHIGIDSFDAAEFVLDTAELVLCLASENSRA
jgi:hypothetical protein